MFKTPIHRRAVSAFTVLAALLLAGAFGNANAESEWLAVCSKCVNPTIFSKSGIGTASAKAEAHHAR